MKPNQRHFLAGALLLLGIGCAGYDDSAEQSEFERLRKYPSVPQGDRILPAFDSEPSSDESLRFAFSSESDIPAVSFLEDGREVGRPALAPSPELRRRATPTGPATA